MVETIVVMFILLFFSLVLLYFLSDEYCDKQVEKIIEEKIKNNKRG